MNLRNIWLAAQTFGNPRTKVPIKRTARTKTNLFRERVKPDKRKVRSRRKLPINENISLSPDNSAETRVADIKILKPKRKTRIFDVQNQIPGMLKAIRWLNLGDEKINEAILALRGRRLFPEWAILFKDDLSVRNGMLYYLDYKFVYKHEKAQEVKKLYFNPRKGATIQTIYDELRLTFANLTRKDVSYSLKGIETYSRNLPKQKAPDVTGRFSFKKPGIIMFDLFFPSTAIHGWHGSKYVLTCLDYWSSYCGIFALHDKKKETVAKAASIFLKNFIAQSGVIPRRAYQDRGTDLKGIPPLFEKFRQKRDGEKPMVIYSLSGTAVHPVEAFNRLVQSRMAIYRTSKLIDEPELLTKSIEFQLNNQKRPNKLNMTPIQLLSLNSREREKVTPQFKDRVIIGVEKQKPIEPGSRVRYLQLTRKEQAETALGAKGKSFHPKWSASLHTVLKKTKLRKNPGFHTYKISGLEHNRFRHELLWLPNRVVVDTSVPRSVPGLKRELIGGLYVPN
jgi:hypothetical protein